METLSRMWEFMGACIRKDWEQKRVLFRGGGGGVGVVVYRNG